MSYFDSSGNKQGKSIYDTKAPLVVEFLFLIVALIVCLSLSGCRTTGLHSVINPIYEAKVNELAATKPVPTAEEIKEALKDIPKWLDKEKLDLRGTGKGDADFANKRIKNDSGIKVPFGDTSVDDLRFNKD